MKLINGYHPITSTPFKNNHEYTEILPCQELRPYIRCFWGSRKPYKQQKSDGQITELVTPDTCMDIIFDVNYSKNTIASSFCGTYDVSFKVNNNKKDEDIVSTFAVRFYAWAAVLFSDESMKGTKNRFFDVGVHFNKYKRLMEDRLFSIDTIEERILITEEYFLKTLNLKRENSLFTRAMESILECNGNIKTLEIARDLHISSRQIERIFNQNMGVTPKKAATLIRYQNLWQEACFSPNFNILHAVYKYGYVDQAHLLNDFKKMHGITLTEARKLAHKHDDFLQYDLERFK